MKGLKQLLPPEKTPNVYWRIQRRPRSISHKQLICWTQHCRYDARLAEQLVEHVRDYWFRYDPAVLNALAQKEPWPSAIGFIVEHVIENCEKPVGIRTEFLTWASTVQRGLSPFPFGLFFIGAWPIASRAMNSQVVESRESYKKWGYYGKDLLFNKQTPGQVKAPSPLGKSLSIDRKAEELDFDMRLKIDLCRRLREYKIQNKLTNREFANRLCLPESKASNIHNCKTKDVSVAFLLKAARRINVTVTDLVAG